METGRKQNKHDYRSGAIRENHKSHEPITHKKERSYYGQNNKKQRESYR